MAKKKYTAIHRIMIKAKPLTYVEPGTSFMIEEAEGEKLLKLGAAKKAAEEAEEPKATAKKPAAKKAAASQDTAESGGDGDDLV